MPRKVLVPVDGSPAASRAVGRAIARCKGDPETEIQLLHVQPEVDLRDVPDLLRPAMIKQLGLDNGDRAFILARSVLDEAAVHYSVHKAMGDPAQEIARHVDANGCSEIFMGTRGLGPVKNLLLGSVAMKVPHLIRVPVTLIK